MIRFKVESAEIWYFVKLGIFIAVWRSVVTVVLYIKILYLSVFGVQLMLFSRSC